MQLKIYTDGACSCNPGPGGWATAFFMEEKLSFVLSGNEKDTTNNRMELMAALKGLKHIKESKEDYTEVGIYSDSAYVVNCINKKYLNRWKNSNWVGASGQPIKNIDLWKEVSDLLSDILLDKNISVRFIKVRGHSGDLLNNIVDQLAKHEVLKIK